MSFADPQKESRTKCRFVMEIRYPPIIHIFDRRGMILEKIFPIFKKKAEHWRVDNAQVIISDNFETPLRLISIGHMSSSITYEDPGSVAEFIDDSRNLLKSIKMVFPEGLNVINRIGFRSISIFRTQKTSEFRDIFNIAKAKFLSPSFPSTLTFNDFHITLAHDSCRIIVGPCKAGEGWVKNTFIDQDNNIPKTGFGVDVDSFAIDVPTPNDNELILATSNVQNLTFSVENEIVNSLLRV